MEVEIRNPDFGEVKFLSVAYLSLENGDAWGFGGVGRDVNSLQQTSCFPLRTCELDSKNMFPLRSLGFMNH